MRTLAILAKPVPWLDPMRHDFARERNRRHQAQSWEAKDGRMIVPTRSGLGVSLSEQARAWIREEFEIDQRP